MPDDISRPIQGLRLSTSARQQFLDNLEQTSQLHKRNAPERRSLRVPFNVDNVIVALLHGTGQTVRFAVPPRNISSGGLAIIHGQFVYPGTRCEVVLPVRGQKMAVRAMGKVTRCEHLKGVVHEVSISFDEPIAIQNFAPLTEPQRLAAAREYERHATKDTAHHKPLRVLLVDDSEPQLKLMSLWLKQYGAQVITGKNAAECYDALSADACGMVVLDLMLGDESGMDVCKELRSRAFHGPIVAISACDEPETQAAALEAGFNVFLAKPLEEGSFIRLIDEIHTFAQRENQPLHSSLAGDPDMQPLIAEFVSSLAETASRLVNAVKAQDALTARKICVQLKGDGGTYGFTALSQMADEVLKQFKKDLVQFDQVTKAAEALAKCCSRAIAA